MLETSRPNGHKRDAGSIGAPKAFKFIKGNNHEVSEYIFHLNRFTENDRAFLMKIAKDLEQKNHGTFTLNETTNQLKITINTEYIPKSNTSLTILENIIKGRSPTNIADVR